MKAAEASAEFIRKDIRNLRRKYGFVNDGHTCDLCGYALLTRPFYMFPCEHVFHTDCFVNEIRPFLDSAQAKELLTLQMQLAEATAAHSVSVCHSVHINL